jgi:hypothetical protein
MAPGRSSASTQGALQLLTRTRLDWMHESPAIAAAVADRVPALRRRVG